MRAPFGSFLVGSPRLSAAVLCCLAIILSGGWLSASTLTVPTELGSGVTIEIELPLSEAPSSGLFPLLVKIHNGTGAASEWVLGTGNSSGRNAASTQTAIGVGPGKSSAVWAYAPMGEASYGYRQLQLTLRGPKILGSGGMWAHPITSSWSSYSGTGAAEFDFPAFSGKVARAGLHAFQDHYKKSHSGSGDLEHAQLDLEKDIGDWRSLSGVGQVWLTDEEWMGLDGGTRATLMDWLTQGGRLVLMCLDTSEERLTALKIPPADANGSRRVGPGRVLLLKWNGVTFPIDEAMPLLKTRDDGDPLPKLMGAYPTKWQLPHSVGEFTVHGWLVFGFIATFGLLVGPVNLFYFAGPKRRHRMFWTTPLISLAGGALLMLVMIFQDGIGGKGARRILAIMNPAQKKTAFLQEQVSRTGVLMSTGFAIDEPVFLQQVELKESGGGMEFSRQNFQTGAVRSGDWFASRSVQAHMIQAVRPSRGGVEYYPASDGRGAPSVVSSLAVPLQQIFITDENGKVWQAQDVATGVKKPMIASDPGELDLWLSKMGDEDLGPLAKNRLQRIHTQRAQAFAVSKEADAFAVPTLKSIRWSDQSVIFAGPYEKH